MFILWCVLGRQDEVMLLRPKEQQRSDPIEELKLVVELLSHQCLCAKRDTHGVKRLRVSQIRPFLTRIRRAVKKLEKGHRK